ncbi:hypothetical protein NIES4072_23060 [Nostoc commune NIES-4072]|uniref:Uncharacterized protein n=1 Tax=Nostoc commune NIES-4072 TaxID=2005467 RepID=A0A2R5FS49_NOSCO|nr:hypothetical protein NIES4072_23060 [Nostoc commune NIES-4072]
MPIIALVQCIAIGLTPNSCTDAINRVSYGFDADLEALLNNLDQELSSPL